MQVMRFTYLLIFVRIFECTDLKINGEVSFDLRISDLDYRSSPVQVFIGADEPENLGDGVERGRIKDIEEKQKSVVGPIEARQVTAAAMVECPYQYPEKEQVNAMLSNMMNQLTKVFVRIHEYVTAEDTRRLETRFRVVGKKDTGFFEHIYNNMSQEYRQFYNNTAERVDRAERDPCQHQEEIKQLWKELLEKSLATLRKAAGQCIEEYLKVQNRSGDEKTRSKLEQFLAEEMSKIKSSQLDVLCDKFQQCYNELL
ncbi:hypothetical protein O3G_MSEX008829 [Manduca sexta]|uniref:Uncharacterized protein n=1 Tax=Manduca sexta TaxID=7130 RepID=A0A921ZD38_MANSE|nr:hypothetical protein O3G_MSEX008829 [Manduca sexta]